ncbi:MAG: hypothetical protein U1A72_08485 [Sulfuritalea sp.]|nr:hypothetical protein [Sulfuritalea sp.]
MVEVYGEDAPGWPTRVDPHQFSGAMQKSALATRRQSISDRRVARESI